MKTTLCIYHAGWRLYSLRMTRSVLHGKSGITYLFGMSEPNDRNLGYAVIMFLGIFVIGTATYISQKLLTPMHFRTIVFKRANSLNFLRIQDPVKLRGAEVGTVRDISWRKGETHVEIVTQRPLDIHKGYRIIAEAKGFMGDRYLAIEPGPSNASAISDTEPLHGIFPMGPAEAIAFSGYLRRITDSISTLARELRMGSANRQPFEIGFNRVTAKFDSITRSLIALLRATDQFTKNNADSLSALLRKAVEMSNSLAVSAPRAVATLETVLAKTGRLLVLADSLLASSNEIVHRMKGEEVAELTERFNELRTTVERLKDAVISLRKNESKLQFRLGG